MSGRNSSRLGDRNGFTLVELIMVLIITGIIALIALPRFFDRATFDSRGFADQVQATLRYAQKVAIAQRRFVCVAFSNAPANVTLTIGATNTCGAALISSTDGTAYSVSANAGINFTALPANFNFDALGRPSGSRTIAVNGVVNAIVVEAETGYVHSP